MSTYSEFAKWYKKFTDDNGIGAYKADKDWFNRVEKSHQKLRKYLGDSRISIIFDVQAGQKLANKEKFSDTINDILKLVPEAKNHLTDKYELLKPIVNINGKGIKTGKALHTWDDRQHETQLNKLISKLGQGWAHASSDDCELTVMLTTMPKAFALLGHLGPDEVSCFKQCGGSCRDKYVLAQTENTFVLLVKKGGKNIARLWGIADKDFKTFTLTNLYMAEGTKEGSVFEAISHFFAYILNVDKSKLYEHHDTIDSEGQGSAHVYLNGCSWSFSTKASVAKFDPRFDSTDIIDEVLCTQCNRFYNKDELHETDEDGYICRDCADNGWNYCEHTLQYTKSDIEDVIINGNCTAVSKKVIKEKGWKKCSDCGVHYNKHTEISKTKRYCKDCAPFHRDEIAAKRKLMRV